MLVIFYISWQQSGHRVFQGDAQKGGDVVHVAHAMHSKAHKHASLSVKSQLEVPSHLRFRSLFLRRLDYNICILFQIQSKWTLEVYGKYQRTHSTIALRKLRCSD